MRHVAPRGGLLITSERDLLDRVIDSPVRGVDRGRPSRDAQRR